MSKEKALLNKESAKAFVEYAKQSGFPFTLKISNYTTEIVSELYNVQFMQSMRSKQCFAAYSKVKRDVKTQTPPFVDKTALTYFSHNFKSDFYSGEVINIDLKSAYATALFLRGVLTQDSFDYLSRIPKLDRLASVGMLASRKHVFQYNKSGILISYQKEVSQYENFFFYAVKSVEEIMFVLRSIAGANYLFTWVDGIYIRPDFETLSEMSEYLQTINFGFTIETLKNFDVKIVSNKVKLNFLKDGKEKSFHIPAQQSLFAADIINYLTNQNLKNEIVLGEIEQEPIE
jgi:hypothetical protein